ncbi:MAG TPA: VanZ family protein [Candidatus Blautia faecavium]|uniref:VanZ family protein n=1 Tax=Candidatus Blautia faecavium TaxID=2838487 RepID=A0A9D2LRV1_9FIRM|nr:VanZ family protein [Candidatus Blautia faecavium]
MKKETKRIIRKTGVFLFVIYVLLLMYLLFFSEGYGRVAEAEREYRYNLVPFVEIRRFWIYREQLGVFALFTNLIGNVLGFIPYGFILPVIHNGLRSGFLIILSGFGLSLCVETIQLVTKVGCFDVDDLILNTLGAALGYLAFAVCDYLRRKYYGKKI